MLKRTLSGLVMMAAAIWPAAAADPDPDNWDAVLAEAKGQTVYFHAWGGEPTINDYIAWAGMEVEARFGVKVVHVKVDDTASVVSKVLTEKAAGREKDGAVDLVWINGENFAAMKREGLLLSKPWSTRLPNYQYVDVENKPSVEVDFTVPVDGLQAPWGMAKMIFFHDTARLDNPPRSTKALGEWIAENPGRFTYPQPPDFMGTSFLKQVLIDLTPDPAVLQKPATDENFGPATAPLFAWLDKAKDNLWRQGRAYPQNTNALRQLLADDEVAIAFAFNPATASNAIANNELPDTVRSFVFDDGTLGNTHFLAVPFNAKAKAGGMVLANFMMSPEAQARKQDAAVWGDPTVLAMDKLSPEDRARFESLDLGIATLKPEELGPVLTEPHDSWVKRIEAEWARRYGASQ